MSKHIKYLALLVVIIFVGSASRSYGMAENWTAQANTALTLQGGTIGLPAGSLIQIGILSTGTSEANMQANQNNIAFLDANFNEWTTGTVGTGQSNQDGIWAIASSGIDGTGFFDQQIYLLAYNAPTAGAAGQVGLYTNPNWKFPTSNEAAANSFDISDAEWQVIIGSYSAGTILSPPGIAGGNALQLHAVPEPSTTMLVIVGFGGVCLFVRRRNK